MSSGVTTFKPKLSLLEIVFAEAKGYEGLKMDANNEIEIDFDPNFEPQTRARSNTWPLRPSRELEPQSSPGADDGCNGIDQHNGAKDPLGLTAKKSGSRRNAWGNLSYADLITKAIQSSPEKRLTLSQIYDWMVQNVPYFKDKGDSTSSAGWKVCIDLYFLALFRLELNYHLS